MKKIAVFYAKGSLGIPCEVKNYQVSIRFSR